MPEADGGMAVEAEPPHQFSTTLRCQAAEAQSDKTASDTEMHMKQRGVTEFLHAEKKITPTDTHRHPPNAKGDQTEDASTEVVDGMYQQWQQSHSRRPCTAVTPRNEEHLAWLMHAN